ncbi:hypothetical protein ES676_00165 [Bizionia saleffrena]|uniref:Uncharacterized protein n=1 Tax=Bizionia saleffrena TaxID=291189 RepID=A0A8H2QKI3_9FLAO|nr:YdeI/OmpD-associated family protein [Bizionia saleffrena]TYB80120.1 hypothetical protein ES676_00165 [Bizionia saleffrena]
MKIINSKKDWQPQRCTKSVTIPKALQTALNEKKSFLITFKEVSLRKHPRIGVHIETVKREATKQSRLEK